MKYFVICLTALLTACSGNSSTEKETEYVVIDGHVTDYEGRPLENVNVNWQNPAFNGNYFTLTDSTGYYCARIPKGRYHDAGAINMDEYPNAGSTLPEADQRLEYWAWNFLADRDTTIDIRYHRMEVYGVNAFQIQGAASGYTVYFRPMSLTRCQAWEQAGEPVGFAALAPTIDKAAIEVSINGAPVKIKMAQEVKEYFSDDTWSNAYLLTVDRPAKEQTVQHFQIVVEDLENGDKGEATYMLEEKTGRDFVWPEEEIDATYRK